MVLWYWGFQEVSKKNETVAPLLGSNVSPIVALSAWAWAQDGLLPPRAFNALMTAKEVASPAERPQQNLRRKKTMQRIVKLSFAGMFLVAVMAAFPLNLLAQGAERTDHMHLPATDGVGYCGVGRHAEPWTLHIAASAGAEAAAVLKVAFRD